MADTNLLTTQFVDVPTTGDQPATKLLNINQTPGLVAPNFAPINAVVADIRGVLASDKLVNTPGNTAAPAPDNFRFIDYTVNVSASIPGDVFKGTTPDVKFQFLDLTPDNIGVTALGPNVFIKTDTGSDILTAHSGRNVLSAGGGFNTMVGASGHDTFLSDASTGNAVASILNFQAGDDAVLTGVSLSTFTFTLTDTLAGLAIDARPVAPNTVSAEIFLQGYKTADFGSKLSLGFSTTADGTSFLFVHAT